MRKHAFTLYPKLDIGHIGKGQIDGSYGAFCPLALCLRGLSCSEHCLHETVDKEQVLVRVALDERETVEDFQWLV